ncbi:MAG TPA: AarF/UbiB family protein [Thermoanaerobaculia bacterium]|nr:AarF/UbiB family protein [Thermoanaerobaculia bacterium]
MAVSLKPAHWKRYKDIAWLLVKYGQGDLASRLGMKDEVAEERPLSDAGSVPAADELARDLERLGPTFVKIGQLLSTRSDLLAPPYLEALARLQDSVEPFPFADVEAIVTEELGARISKAFLEFEAAPVAAASLGQVHRARLRDGRRVAVKVQRPGIRDQILEDLEAFAEVAELLDRRSGTSGPSLTDAVREFRKALLAELDYRQEARNLVTIGENLAEFERIVVPSPVEDYTTSRVLTMEYVRGRKVTALSPVVRIELEGRDLAEELFRAYLKQILIDGFFHADPHPGNVFVTDDRRLALLDLGMVARISPQTQERLLKLLFAVCEGRADEAARQSAGIGKRLENFDRAEYGRRITDLVARYQHATVSQLQVGRVILEVSRAAAETGLLLPSELTLLGKTLLQLDEVGRTLDPQFDPNASVRENTAELLERRMWKSTSPGSLASTLLETREFIQKLPERVNRFLDLVAENRLRVRVDAIDERSWIEVLHKIANRVAMGLVLAALIVGAALLMQVPTSFRILGYPGLAILFFFVAAAGGFVLVLNILFDDRRSARQRRPR